MESILYDILMVEKILVPELLPVFFRRYEILNIISLNEPIGRRSISNILGLGEKIVRNEVTRLQEESLIYVNSQGMYVTDEGRNILKNAESWINKLKALDYTEKELSEFLSIRKVIIVSGNTKDPLHIKRMAGKKAAEYLKSILSENMIVGITGGTTMAAMAKEMPKANYSNKNITIVPARGGLGVNAETQANNIAAVIAQKLNCSYKLLHLTENLSKELLETIKEYPEIKEILEYIRKMNALVFGIGRADVMFARRNLKKDRIEFLKGKGAVAEAFGYYFDEKGKIVDVVNTVGINLEQYYNLDHVIGVATGVEKAHAIMAISKLNPNLVLIIDEALAGAVLENK